MDYLSVTPIATLPETRITNKKRIRTFDYLRRKTPKIIEIGNDDGASISMNTFDRSATDIGLGYFFFLT